MTDLRAMSDDELEALKEKGEEAAEILDERALVAARAERARTPLTPALVLQHSGAYEIRTDEHERMREYYGNVPLDVLLAACPIPPGMMATSANAHTMALRWDEYIYLNHLAPGDAAEPLSNAMLRRLDIYRCTKEHGA